MTNEIKERIKKEVEDFYGEEAPGGHMQDMEKGDESIYDIKEAGKGLPEYMAFTDEMEEEIDPRIPRIEDLSRLDYLD